RRTESLPQNSDGRADDAAGSRQQGKRRQPQIQTVENAIAMRAAVGRQSVELAVGSLGEIARGIASMSVIKRINHAEHAAGSDSVDGAAVGSSAAVSDSVRVAIGGTHGSENLVSVGGGTEIVNHRERARGSERIHHAIAGSPA